MKVAVITPYCREPETWLLQMLESVARQTHPVTHILVGDGVRRASLDGPGRIQMHLKKPVGDSGGTPRALGGTWARNNGFEMIVYVDADDHVSPDFIETLVAARRRCGADIISTPLILNHIDLTPIRHPEGRFHGRSMLFARRQVGGEEYVFLPAGGLALAGDALAQSGLWTGIPRRLNRVHDLIFSQALLSLPLAAAWLTEGRYHYRLTRAIQYLRNNLEPPAEMASAEKSGEEDDAKSYLASLDADQRRQMEIDLGIDIEKVPKRGFLQPLINEAASARGMVLRDRNFRYEVVAGAA